MKLAAYCLGCIALIAVLKLAVMAAAFASGYYFFHVKTPRPHVTMKYIERAPGAEPLGSSSACEAIPASH